MFPNKILSYLFQLIMITFEPYAQINRFIKKTS